MSHYKDIHRFLFAELYDWAGELRQVDLAKKGTSFVPAADIERCANAYFLRVSKIDFSKLSTTETVSELADMYSTLNLIHPFREGNGRVQRIFFRQWLHHIGYDIDFSYDPDLLMVATICAAQGIMDDLIKLFDELLEPLNEMHMDLNF